MVAVTQTWAHLGTWDSGMFRKRRTVVSCHIFSLMFLLTKELKIAVTVAVAAAAAAAGDGGGGGGSDGGGGGRSGGGGSGCVGQRSTLNAFPQALSTLFVRLRYFYVLGVLSPHMFMHHVSTWCR